MLKYLLKPTGAFFPGLTLVTVLAGIMYGCMYYRKPITLRRVLVSKLLVMLVCNVILNTMCLSILYGKGFMVLLPARALKNLVMWPIDSMIFFIPCQKRWIPWGFLKLSVMFGLREQNKKQRPVASLMTHRPFAKSIGYLQSATLQPPFIFLCVASSDKIYYNLKCLHVVTGTDKNNQIEKE